MRQWQITCSTKNIPIVGFVVAALRSHVPQWMFSATYRSGGDKNEAILYLGFLAEGNISESGPA